MFNLDNLIHKAKSSKFFLWVLNQGLDRMIPFNIPHGFRIIEIRDTFIKTKLPYKRKNKNHIGGLHACALATLSEFTTGVLLLTGLDAKKYRIILKTLEVDYHYQGKMDAFASFRLEPEELKEKVYKPLETEEAVTFPCEVSIHDLKGNHLTTARVYWQIKDWTKVRTRK